jgi:hypothetical protein
MNTLELANALELSDKHPNLINVNNRAAAELRRLHSVNADLLEAIVICEGNIASLLASHHPKVYGMWLDVVRAAIAKATGEQP